MSQIELSNAERSRALQRFGYSEREAQFLTIAALHGGYFVRSQYCRFIDRQIGGTAAELVRKLLANDHATAVAGCHNTKVYHLAARPFYAALGQEDNRNRRARPAIVIKNKLMCLDFVLDHPGRYLATEQEKVDYFHGTLQIPAAELPCKLFRSPTSIETTTRCFVDKYPIFLSEEACPPPVVSFCFVDEGLVTDSHFDSYLRQYAPLFKRMPAFRLIYIAASELPFKPAKKAFEKFFGLRQESPTALQDEAVRTRLFAYFEARRLYEAAQLETFDRSKLISLRDDRQAFSGPEYEALYRLWTGQGASAVEHTINRANFASKSAQGIFETVLLKYNYSLFGSVSRIQFRGNRRMAPTVAAKTHAGANQASVVAAQDKE